MITAKRIANGGGGAVEDIGLEEAVAAVTRYYRAGDPGLDEDAMLDEIRAHLSESPVCYHHGDDGASYRFVVA